MMKNDESPCAELEGRVRAIESLILTMALSPEQFAAAKDAMRTLARAKGKLGDLQEKLAGADRPLDEHGERAIADLAYRHQKLKTT